MDHVQHSIAGQKAVANELLASLQHEQVMVAGGAPRDWYNGEVANDIDFFIHIPWEFDADFKRYQEDVLAQAGIDDAVKLGENNYENREWLYDVFEFKYRGQKCQFIFSAKPLSEIVDSFPYANCQAWYEDGEVKATPEFKLAFQMKCIVRDDTDDRPVGFNYMEKIECRYMNRGFHHFFDVKSFIKAIGGKGFGAYRIPGNEHLLPNGGLGIGGFRAREELFGEVEVEEVADEF